MITQILTIVPVTLQWACCTLSRYIHYISSGYEFPVYSGYISSNIPINIPMNSPFNCYQSSLYPHQSSKTDYLDYIISTIYDFSQWYPHIIPTIPPCLFFKSLFPWQHRDTPQQPWQRHFPGWGRKWTSRRCPRESGIPQDMGPRNTHSSPFLMFRGRVRCELRNFDHDNRDLWIFLGIRYYNMFVGSV